MIGLGLGSQPTAECGIFGSYQSLALDGNSDFVTFGEGLKNTINKSAGTVSFWVSMVENDGDTTQQVLKIFTDTSNQFQILYHKYYTEWRAVIKTQGTVRKAAYDIPGSSNDDGSGYGLGWQHFTASWVIADGAYSVKLYRNGNLAQDTNNTTGQLDWAGDVDVVVIGSNQDGTGSFVDGYIDQFAIWDLELPAAAITAIYNGGVMRDLTTQHENYTQTENLIGYCQFEGNDTTGNALDSSPYGHHGTLRGSARFDSRQP